MRSMNVEWNKAVRRTLCILYNTHRNLLPYLVDGKPFAVQHRSRVTNFLASFTDSANSRVRYIGERAKIYSHGALGRNFTRCGGHVELENSSTDLRARASAIRELLDIRDGISSLLGLTHIEVIDMIDTIGCN